MRDTRLVYEGPSLPARQKLVLIYNPAAGKLRRDPRRLDRVLRALRQAGYEVVASPTEGPRTAAAIAMRHASTGASVIAAYGGDGTINEVAGGMIGSDVPLAILPGGTANVLANELGLSRSSAAVAENLPELVARRIAVGRLRASDGQARDFLLMAGAGLDADIVSRVSTSVKAVLGKGAYWVGGFSSALRMLPEFDVEVNGRRHRVSFALVSRVRNYGGDLEIARSVRLTDSDFEIVLFEGSLALRYLKYMAGVVTNSLSGMTGVSVIRARSIRVLDDAPLHVDGEMAAPGPAEIETVPDAISILMPRGYGRS